MEQKSLRRKTTDGMLWNTLERVLTQGMQFIFSVLIARILIPEDYGIIAIANFFISISDIFVDSGFSRALIREKERDEADYNSVFYFNLAASSILYLLLWFAAPIIANYYDSPILTNVIRAITPVLIINALGAIQALRMNIDLNFRPIAISSSVSMLVSGIAAWILAMCGLGVWALVAQTVIMALVRSIMLCVLVKWHPSAIFSWKKLKKLFSFGSKLLLSDCLARIYNGVFTLGIGKVFSTQILGFYGKADSFASMPSTLIAGPVRTVTYPAMNGIQDDKARLGESLCQMSGLVGFVITPMMAGLALISSPLVSILLTDKWLYMVPLLQVFCLSNLFITLTSLFQNALLIRGRSGAHLFIQIASRVLGLLLLIFTIRHSIIAVCLGISVVSIMIFFAYAVIVSKDLNITWLKLLKSFIPSILLTAAMAIAVYVSMMVFDSLVLKLVVGVVVGIIVYIGLAALLSLPQYKLLSSLIKPYLDKIKPQHNNSADE